jgi:hypothetical protein
MQEIQALIAHDQLREALDHLLALSHWSTEQSADLLQISAQLAAQERSSRMNNQSPEVLTVQRNQIREAILRYALVPASTSASKAAHNGSALKKQAFYLLIIGKILLFLLVAFHFSTHGFSQGEALMIITILSPTLIGYLMKASQDHQAPLSAEAQRRLPTLRFGVYFLLPLYFLLIAWILDRTPRDVWEFETTRNWLLGIETSFGALIVWLMNSLFSDK